MSLIYLVVGRSGDNDFFDEWIVAVYSDLSQASRHKTLAQTAADLARIRLKQRDGTHTMYIELGNAYDPKMSFEYGDVWYEVVVSNLLRKLSDYVLSAPT